MTDTIESSVSSPLTAQNGTTDTSTTNAKIRGAAEPCRWYPTRLLSGSTSATAASIRDGNKQNSLNSRGELEDERHDQPQRQSTSHTATTTSNEDSNPIPNPNPYAILILNQPLNSPALDVLLSNATLVVCADAGADRYLKYVRQTQKHHEGTSFLSPFSSSTSPEEDDKTENNGTRRMRLPDAIIGDLDSIRPSTRTHFQKQGVQIIHDPDQYSTDFTKCLKWIRQYPHQSSSSSSCSSLPSPPPSSSIITSDNNSNDKDEEDEKGLDVIVLGSLGGRVDQGLSQIHHLYLAISDKSLLRPPSSFSSSVSTTDQNKKGNKIYLLSESSLSFVLEPGRNEIYIDDYQPRRSSSPHPSNHHVTNDDGHDGHDDGHGDDDNNDKEQVEMQTFTENIGILPIAGPALLTTSGLEWDVEDWRTEFGGQLSTSNHIKSREVMVEVKSTTQVKTETETEKNGADDDGTGAGKVNRCLFTLELTRRLRLE